MSETPSNMLPLGTRAPNFSLPDTVSGKTLSLQELKSNTATVVMFICNHCPYVVHIQDELLKVIQEYQEKGIQFIAISANDADNYPQDGPEKMKIMAEEKGYTFPYLYDATQAVAKAYQAACTPDFYVFDKALACVYRGRFDEATPGKDAPITGKEMRHALDCAIAGKDIPDQKPSLGCNIKWKKQALI